MKGCDWPESMGWSHEEAVIDHRERYSHKGPVVGKRE
jgi:hypothetical protein